MTKILGKMNFILVIIVLLNSCTTTGNVQNDNSNMYENITSKSIGIYYENEKYLLETGFINAVNRWLRRYSPKMITQSDNYVKMQAKYDYFYDIELFIKNDIYEIVVTFAQAGRRPSDAQEDAVHLSTGILKVMEDYIANRVHNKK
jgi:lysophospholipase L1-like esterase